MTRTVTYQELSNIMSDIQMQSSVSPAFSLFHHDKIQRFYTLNSLRIKSFNEKVLGLVDKFVKKDESGKPVILENKQYDFETDTDKEIFKEEYTAFASRSFDLNI